MRQAVDYPVNQLVSRYAEFAPECRARFVQSGYPARYFFPHRVYYLPKAGPDAAKIAARLELTAEPNALWEILLYADSPASDEFPDALYFDDEVVWHQQHLQKRGLVATANLVIQNNVLYTNTHLSDLVQRISRRREFKTRIQNHFTGWHHVLLNAILYFALTQQLETIFVPTVQRVLMLADPKRRDTINPHLFQRVYDGAVQARLDGEQKNDWWQIPVAQNASRVVMPHLRQESLSIPPKIICVCHDIERGMGHKETNKRFARSAAQNAPGALTQMLAVEKEFGIHATYNIVGTLMPETRAEIERGGHCVAFHSYDHDLTPVSTNQPRSLWEKFFAPRVPPPSAPRAQIARCRDVDYRIKGYRAPQSQLYADLTEKNLLYHNFEWLASSAYSFGFDTPQLQNRIVKIPILFDDHTLYARTLNYAKWEQDALAKIAGHAFVAFGLHDCYAPFWLPHYRGFLAKIQGQGEFQTLNQVAANVFLANAIGAETPPSAWDTDGTDNTD